jgi:hypothetical protein
VFVSRRELREVTGLPVLGSVSFALGPQDRALAKRRFLMFGAAAAALPVALGLAVLLQNPAHRAIAGLLAVLPT